MVVNFKTEPYDVLGLYPRNCSFLHREIKEVSDRWRDTQFSWTGKSAQLKWPFSVGEAPLAKIGFL